MWYVFLQAQVVLLEQLSGTRIIGKKEWQRSNCSNGCLYNQIQQLMIFAFFVSIASTKEDASEKRMRIVQCHCKAVMHSD